MLFLDNNLYYEVKMSIQDEKKEDYTLITVMGSSLAGKDSIELKTRTISLIDDGVVNICLDLSMPEFIDSSGIGKLLFMNKKVELVGGKFSITQINPTLFESLNSLGITRVIDIAKPKK